MKASAPIACLLGTVLAGCSPYGGPVNLPGIAHACDEVGTLMKRDGVIMPDAPDKLGFCVPVKKGRF